jgi:nucleoside-diphosphate-sugar epimerase
MDGLDAVSVGKAVAAAEADVIVHQMTAISRAHAGKPDIKHPDKWFAGTNRLRAEGTDHLLAAAEATGVAHFVAQGYASWNGNPEGGWVKTEEDPVNLMPGTASHAGLQILQRIEDKVLKAGGAVLRYGAFYGPGTSLAPGAEQFDLVRKRKFPLVGDGAGVWSFVHVADAAEATVAAIEHGSRGVYNVVDDDPAPVAEWLPALAEVIGAPAPRRVPRWVGRLFAGEAGVVMMTEMRGASNAKAKRELGWQPMHPSWRQGFAAA